MLSGRGSVLVPEWWAEVQQTGKGVECKSVSFVNTPGSDLYLLFYNNWTLLLLYILMPPWPDEPKRGCAGHTLIV